MADMSGAREDGFGQRNAGGRGPVFLALREVAALPDKAARKAHLLERLDHAWQQATERGYLNKAGDFIPNPDGSTQTKVIDLAAELMGAHGEERAARPADLSVFNGGKGAARKAG